MIVICGLKVLLWEAGSSAGRVLEELELKPTQPSTEVWLGLGLRLSLAKTLTLICYILPFTYTEHQKVLIFLVPSFIFVF